MSYLKDDGRENIMFKGPVAKGNIVIKKQEKVRVAGAQRTSNSVMVLDGW